MAEMDGIGHVVMSPAGMSVTPDKDVRGMGETEWSGIIVRLGGGP
jgi:hypothetical protein